MVIEMVVQVTRSAAKIEELERRLAEKETDLERERERSREQLQALHAVTASVDKVAANVVELGQKIDENEERRQQAATANMKVLESILEGSNECPRLCVMMPDPTSGESADSFVMRLRDRASLTNRMNFCFLDEFDTLLSGNLAARSGQMHVGAITGKSVVDIFVLVQRYH